MEQGFIKASSANLPRIDLITLGTFLGSNKDFCSAEFRNVKTSIMSSDIITSLQIEADFPSKVITVKEFNKCDSSFIVSCVLCHCVKSKSALLILSTHNSMLHYHQVGLKMNYSLQKNIESDRIQFLNIGEELVSDVLLNEDNSLQQIYMKIKDKIQQMQKAFTTVNLIFEGVSHLFDLQYSLVTVNELCNNLIKLCRHINNSFIFFHCYVASEDDVTYTLSNLLAHKAYTVVEVENLPSGWSTDVSGHLVIKYPGRKFQDEHIFVLENKPVKYLFKLFDRGVKLFAPGTV